MAVQAENMVLAMCASQDWLMSSVLGIDDGMYFNLQEQPPQTTQLQHKQGFQSLGFNSYQGASSSSCGGDFDESMAFSQSLAVLLEKQRQEIDWILQLQNERLRTTLHEEGRKQLAVLLQRYESNTKSLLWQKDEHLALATRKTMELEDWLRKAEMESQAWKKKAKENEAKVLDLNNTLTQVRERVHDAESFCDSSSNREDENRGDNDREEESKRKMGCKFCNARSSCVVLLPCRHLCSCKSCEAFLRFCPVCESVKEASMEVFLV